jgi:hypothetical protein
MWNVTALTWTLRAIARLEGPDAPRPRRLTEPDFVRWRRLSPRGSWRSFIALLHEDLAPSFPYPFDLERWARSPLADLEEDAAERLVRETAAWADEPERPDTATFLRNAARDLGLPSGGALSDLPRTSPGQRVLELPGTGGRVASHQIENLPGLALHVQFAFVADTDAERITVGLAVVEARANEPVLLTSDAAVAAIARGERFDRLVGHRSHAAAEALVARLARSDLEVRWL